MKNIILLMVIGLIINLSASEQSEDKKNRLRVAVELLGGNCGYVESYTEIKGYGGNKGRISIYCSNGMNYSLSKGAYGYELKVR